MYHSQIRHVDSLKSHLIKSGNISNTFSSMKRSGSGDHVFELAFEHMDDILNTDFKYVRGLQAHTTRTVRALSSRPTIPTWLRVMYSVGFGIV